MRTIWENVWTFDTARFRVTLDCAPETDVDISWDETGETADKLDSGEWLCLQFRVRVTCDGREIGCDYLGNSIYADPAEFRNHIGLAAKSRADGCNYGSYFSDMMRTAIAEARATLCKAPRVRCAA